MAGAAKLLTCAVSEKMSAKQAEEATQRYKYTPLIDPTGSSSMLVVADPVTLPVSCKFCQPEPVLICHWYVRPVGSECATSSTMESLAQRVAPVGSCVTVGAPTSANVATPDVRELGQLLVTTQRYCQPSMAVLTALMSRLAVVEFDTIPVSCKAIHPEPVLTSPW